MCRINIKEILKDRDYPTAGEYVYSIMEECIPNSEVVTLNMDGVDTLPSMFLNTSIGQYIQKYGPDSLKGKLAFEKIMASQVTRIKEYMSRLSVA